MFEFSIKAFKELSVDELYSILQLREAVFIIEQHCLYTDIDNIDQQCYHVFALQKDAAKINAYARLVPPDLKFDVPSIGRVIIDESQRGKGLGKALMQKAIQETFVLFNTNTIKISAQTYLLKFYSDLGFTPISKAYDEDGIEHIDMVLNKNGN